MCIILWKIGRVIHTEIFLLWITQLSTVYPQVFHTPPVDISPTLDVDFNCYLFFFRKFSIQLFPKSLVFVEFIMGCRLAICFSHFPQLTWY